MSSILEKASVSAVCAVFLFLAGSLYPVCSAAEEKPPSPAVILDTMSFWRIHQTIKPPVAQVNGEVKPCLNGGPWTEWETPPPPPDWTGPDFDDHGWVRPMARMTGYSPYLARVCLRGKFAVTDP